MALVGFGLLVSIPVVVWGSTFVIRLMDRFPWVITLGGMLMGWIAGTMAVTDPAILPFVPTSVPADALANAVPKVQSWFYQFAGVASALLVFLVGQVIKRRRPTNQLDPD